MPHLCNCENIVSSRCYLIVLAVPVPVRLFGLVIRDASFAQVENCLVTMALYFVFCGASPSNTNLGNFAVYHIGIYSLKKNILYLPLFTLEKLCGFAPNPPLTSVLCLNIQRVVAVCPNDFPYSPCLSDL